MDRFENINHVAVAGAATFIKTSFYISVLSSCHGDTRGLGLNMSNVLKCTAIPPTLCHVLFPLTGSLAFNPLKNVCSYGNTISAYTIVSVPPCI